MKKIGRKISCFKLETPFQSINPFKAKTIFKLENPFQATETPFLVRNPFLSYIETHFLATTPFFS